MTRNLVINSVEVEGFRGFNTPKRFEFEKPFVILYGDGGRGKSSLLRGIEWCLFGNTAYQDFSESPRTKDELVNQHHTDGIARVKLAMNRGKEEYSFLREKERGSEKMKFSVAEPKETLEGEKAEERCLVLLGSTYTDFYRTIYLHQEAVRGILTDKSSERDEALDRLLGLEVLRNIVESVPISDVKSKATELEGKKNKIEDRIKGRIQQIELDRSRNLEKCKKLGITKEKITFKFGRRVFELVLGGLQKVGRECKLEPPQIDSPKTVDSLTGGLRKAKKFLTDCRYAIVEISEMDELTGKRTKFQELLAGLNKDIQEMKKINNELGKIKRKHGDESKIRLSIRKLEGTLTGIEKERKELDVKLRLLNDAIEYLEKVIVDICPVCGYKVKRKEILTSLRAQIAQYQTKTIKQLDGRKVNAENQKEALEDAQSSLIDFRGDLETAKEGKDDWLNKIFDVAGKKLNEKEAIAFLRGNIKRLNNEIGRLREAYKKKVSKLESIDSQLEKIKAVHDVLVKEEELEQLKKISSEEADEIKMLQNKILELNTFRDQLAGIIDAITTVQTRLASEMIKKASPKISQFYSNLGGHPYYKNLAIDVQPRKTRGGIKNSYQIKASHPIEGIETLVSTRFSTSQMNCTALSIFLAMSETFSRRIGFLILDDPSQNLDSTQKKALIQVLNKVLSRRQLFISTQDAEFQKMLLQLIPKNKRVVYNFTAWSKKDGPHIIKTK